MAGDLTPPPDARRPGELRVLVVRDARPVREFRVRRRTLWRVGAWGVGVAWLLPLVVLGGIAAHAQFERARLVQEVGALTTQAQQLSTHVAQLEQYAGLHPGTPGAGGPADAAPTEPDVALAGASTFVGELSRRFSAVRAIVHDRIARQRSTPQGAPVDTDRSTSSGFGWRSNPFTGEGAEWHSGLDFPAPVGTPVYATADGTVDWAGRANGLGLGVALHHADGYTSVFGHLRDATVAAGQSVVRGQVIGHVGNGGRSTGPHVHYEVRRHGEPVDPRAVRPAGAPTPRR